MGVGAYVVTGEYTPTCLIFFYKVFGNVKGMLYLCIVMYYCIIDSVVPHLIENKKFLTSFNKKIKDKQFSYMGCNYGVDGYAQVKVLKGQLIFKVYVTQGYCKFYRQSIYSNVSKGDSVYRRLTNRVRCNLKHHLHNLYGKHLGLKYFEFDVSVSWV